MNTAGHRGDFKLERHGRVIIIRALNSWDEWTMRRFSEYVRNEFMPPVIGEPWALITDISRWGLTDLDSFEVIKEIQDWGLKNNLHYRVIVTPNDTIRNMFTRLTDADRMPELTYFATSEEEAWEILSTRGYPGN